MELCPADSVNVGHFRGIAEFSLKEKVTGHGQIPRFFIAPLEIKGKVLPVVQSFPESLANGVMAVGATQSDTITLSAHGKSLLADYVEASGSGKLLARQLNPAGNAHLSIWEVSFECERAGLHQEDIKFNVRVGDSPLQHEVVVPLSYVGTTDMRKLPSDR